MAILAFAQQPSWWSSRGIIKPMTEPMDYAMANQGQLKNFARAARDEMLQKQLIQEGHAIDLMVRAWVDSPDNALDFGAVNQGQLKKVATPFYDQLVLLHLRPQYPRYPWPWWSNSDFVAVNQGQLKNIFAFNIPSASSYSYATGLSANFWDVDVYNGLVTWGILAGDQDIHSQNHSGVAIQTVKLKGGTNAYFGYDGTGLRSGTLACDQVLECGDGKVASFKAGTDVYFTWDGYVQRGILSGDEILNYNATMSAEFAGDTEIEFTYDGYVSKGSLSSDQWLHYNAQMQAQFAEGTVVEISGYVYTGVLSGDQVLSYSATLDAAFKGNTEIQFNALGYVSTGILSTDQDLNYAPALQVRLKAGTIANFLWAGAVSSGTLSVDQVLNYNPLMQAVFAGDTEIIFSYDGYVNEGILSSDQMVNYNPQNQAEFAGDTGIIFTYDGYVYEGTLSVDQAVYYRTAQSANIKGGEQAWFWSGYLTYCTLASDQPLYFSLTETRNYKGNSLIEFNSTGFVYTDEPSSLMNDSDNDGLIDLFEIHVFGSLAESPLSDFDYNGLTNHWEIVAWTSFIGSAGWNLQGDEDSDGLNLLEELMMRTNFKAADTDGDGVNDAQDLHPLDPNLSSLLTAVSKPGAPIIQLISPADATLVP